MSLSHAGSLECGLRKLRSRRTAGSVATSETRCLSRVAVSATRKITVVSAEPSSRDASRLASAARVAIPTRARVWPARLRDGTSVRNLRNTHHCRGNRDRHTREDARETWRFPAMPTSRAFVSRARRDGVASRAQRRTRLVVRPSTHLSRDSREAEGLAPPAAVSRDARTWSRVASTDELRGDFRAVKKRGSCCRLTTLTSTGGVLMTTFSTDRLRDRGTHDDRSIALKPRIASTCA